MATRVDVLLVGKEVPIGVEAGRRRRVAEGGWRTFRDAPLRMRLARIPKIVPPFL